MTDQPRRQTTSDREKIQAPSIPVLKDGLWGQTVPIGRQLSGHPLSKGDMLNALVTWFLLQPKEMRLRIISEGLERFREILAGEATFVVPSSVPTDDLLGRGEMLSGIVVGLNKDIDTKGENEPAQRRATPKRRS